MKSKHVSFLLSAVMGALLLSFNNCGKVTFEQANNGFLQKPVGESSEGVLGSHEQEEIPPSAELPSNPQPPTSPQMPTNPEQPMNRDMPTASPGQPTVPPTYPPTHPEEDITPLVKKAGVVTILLALGDQIDNQLVIQGLSSQLIAQTAVRYASPKANPKILVVKDSNTQGESAYDTTFIANELLERYEADVLTISSSGLRPQQVEGYDLVWFNNPGHPMGSVRSRDTLLSFKGGVVLSGDDLSRGTNFSLEALTGLRYVDNGVKVICSGREYQHDNNGGFQYGVSIVPNKFPGVPVDSLKFVYGNDIDNVRVSSPNTEVIAYAVGGHSSCTDARPPITRRLILLPTL